MMIAAVIAEYNPFHHGHAYQLKEIRRQTGADLILVMMSGDFVQRGAPSCVDKYARCRMALAAGADMVCELPVYGAIGSAEIFAESAVSLLNRLGCIDYLCFGAETIAPSLFDAIIPILSDEPDEYKAFLQAGLKTGMNFPAARSRALCSILGDAQCSDILNQPNNILAIESVHFPSDAVVPAITAQILTSVFVPPQPSAVNYPKTFSPPRWSSVRWTYQIPLRRSFRTIWQTIRY